MQFHSEARIVDITKSSEYEKYLHRCLVGPPSKRYKKRISYLEKAIPKGFHKKLLISEGKVIGTIEYAPSEVSYYPIIGDNVVVMNCIWVLRKAKGHNFGRMLAEDMIESERKASCFATIALTGHWSPWFRKWQMEKLGFKQLESVSVTHKTKHKGKAFSIYLMWMPIAKDAQPPSWDRQKLLGGITACIAHPLYHPQTYKPRQIFEEHQSRL
jgi:N-acetylglutamate synthase-like GNAT family acetyltransferase